MRSNYNIIEFETIDSTNSFALENFEFLEDKTIITSLEQTNGRGRFNRVWVSDNCENIYMSFLLKPFKKENVSEMIIPPEATRTLSKKSLDNISETGEISDLQAEPMSTCDNQTRLMHRLSNSLESVDYMKLANLTQYLSVVVSKVLESYNADVQIKYPNDVLCEGKKICGILCESFLKKGVIEGVVLGIGINLNTPQKILDSIGQPAISLNIVTQTHIDRYVFLNKLIDEFFLNYDKVLEFGFSSFREDYLKRIRFLGKSVFIQQRDGDEKFQCTALKFDENGNLIVKMPDGLEKKVLSGDLMI